MEKFVLVDGGTKKQRDLVEDIAWWFCEKYFSRFKSFNIEIDLCKLEGDDFITCVLHELVHVKQQFKGELKELGGFQKMWKGEVHIGVDYYNLPWEKEAYKMQEILLEEYKNGNSY